MKPLIIAVMMLMILFLYGCGDSPPKATYDMICRINGEIVRVQQIEIPVDASIRAAEHQFAYRRSPIESDQRVYDECKAILKK